MDWIHLDFHDRGERALGHSASTSFDPRRALDLHYYYTEVSLLLLCVLVPVCYCVRVSILHHSPLVEEGVSRVYV